MAYFKSAGAISGSTPPDRVFFAAADNSKVDVGSSVIPVATPGSAAATAAASSVAAASLNVTETPATTVRLVIPSSFVIETLVAPPGAALIVMAWDNDVSPATSAATLIDPSAAAIWSIVKVTSERTSISTLLIVDAVKSFVSDTISVSVPSPPLMLMTSVAMTVLSPLTLIWSFPPSVLMTSPSAYPTPSMFTMSAPSPKFSVSAPAPTVITSICELPVTVTPSSFNTIVLVEVVAPDRSSAVSPAASVAVSVPVVSPSIASNSAAVAATSTTKFTLPANVTPASNSALISPAVPVNVVTADALTEVMPPSAKIVVRSAASSGPAEIVTVASVGSVMFASFSTAKTSVAVPVSVVTAAALTDVTSA